MPINKQVYDLVGLLSPYFARTGGAGTGGGAGLDWAPATTTAGVDKDGAEDNGGAGWTRMAGHTYLWAPLKITEILWDISVAGTYAMYISSGPSAVVQRTVVAAQVVAAPGTEVSFVPDAGVLCLDAGEYWLTVEISAGTCAWDVFHGDAENVLYYAFDSYMDAVVKPDWVAPFKMVAHIGTWLGTVAPGTTLAHGDLTGVLPDQHHARGHTLDSETDHTDVENAAKADGRLLVWRDIPAKHGYEDLIPGPQGDQGDPGPQGDQGAVGAQGDQGDQGAAGAQGNQGNQGDQGDQGDQGGTGGYTEGARVYNNADISIAKDTETKLTFNSENYDTDTIHDTGANTSRLTCKTAGKYLITAYVEYAASSTGVRYMWLLLDNTTIIAFDREPQPFTYYYAGLRITTIYDLAVNQYVELGTYQNSGGALAVKYASAFTPWFMMQRIG